MDKAVVVDKNGKLLDLRDKIERCSGKGILHRAFSVFVFNKKGIEKNFS